METSSKKSALTGAQAASQGGLGRFFIVFECNLKEHCPPKNRPLCTVEPPTPRAAELEAASTCLL